MLPPIESLVAAAPGSPARPWPFAAPGLGALFVPADCPIPFPILSAWGEAPPFPAAAFGGEQCAARVAAGAQAG
jgi:hypothetical protein